MLSIFSCAYWPSICLLWRNAYLGLLPIFHLGCLLFCCWVIWVVYIFWRLSPYQCIIWTIFSHSVACLFLFFLWFPLLCRSVWVHLDPICLFLFVYLLPWETVLRKHLYSLCQRMFSSSSFVVSYLMCKPLSHFEFIFVHHVRVCSSFTDLHAAVQFPQHYLLKRLPFFHFVFLPPLLKINWP